MRSVIKYSTQRLLEVGDEIYGRLDTDADPEKSVRHPSSHALLRVQSFV
jgi:hypothetical protein